MRGKIVVIAIAALSVFLLREPVFNYLNYLEEGLRLKELVSELPKVSQSDLDSLVRRVEEKVQAPPPLRAKVESPEATLTKDGVISWTNIQRINNNLPGLEEKLRLNLAATLKLKDMFEKQYFDHVSPLGVGPAQVVGEAGYEFILVGENLALGNFQDDKVLVQAWMDSPGHRANILGARFTEIGVAVGRGIYEGRQTWLAVQEFGLPLSACPEPKPALKSQIQNLETESDELVKLIGARRTEIEDTRPRRGPEYNQKIDEYNALVSQYNNLVSEVKSLIVDYNNEVNTFNSCLQQFSL